MESAAQIDPPRGHHLPADPDVDLHDPTQRDEMRRPWAMLAVISAGGAIGAVARYAIGLALPFSAHSFPWGTFVINIVGCFLIGVLMVLVTEVWRTQRYVRPFLGVGVLGGFTTFSTYIVDAQRLVNAGSPGIALAYLAATVFAALTAVYAGITLAERAVGNRRPTEERVLEFVGGRS